MSEDELYPETLVLAKPTGKQTETRIKDASSARSLVRAVIFEDQQRAQRRTLVKGLIDGNPPYDSVKQRNAGLAWQANLNLMEGKALMDSSGIPYYSLFTGAEPYVEAFSDFMPDHPDHNLWCGKIATRFHQMLKRWPQFEWHIQQASFWMRLHGIGPCLWDRDDDWRFRAVDTGCMLVPKNSPSCIDCRVPYVVVRIKYRAHELFKCIRDEGAAKAQGWDVEAVKIAIQNSHRNGSEAGIFGSTSWEELQRTFKNDDLVTAFTKCDEIATAHIYANEYSGKVSHFIITEAPLHSDRYLPDGEWTRRFLYKHVARYDHLEDAMAVFFQDIGDGTWHSVRGLADLAFKHLEVLNRLDCRMIDGAFIDGGIVLQPEGVKDIDKIQSIQWGPFTVLPAGLKMQQGRVSGQLEGTMAVSRTVRNGLSNNIGMFNQRSVTREDGRGEAVTAAQIHAQVAKESTLSSGQMALAYLTYDQLCNGCLRIAKNPSTQDDEARRFQRECEADGVPKEALAMARVRANRAAGFGSPQMAFMVLNQLLPVLGMFPEDGKKAYLDMFVQATVGAEKVRTLNPEHHLPGDDDWVAANEGLMFDSGRNPPLAAGQNDVVHVQAHLADAEQKLSPLRDAVDSETADPNAIQQALVYLKPMLDNTEAHLARMQTDPARRQLVPMFEKQLKRLVDFNGDLFRALTKAQRAQALQADMQQNATALDAKTAAEVRATEAGILIDSQKAQSKMENDRIKTLNTAHLKRVQAASDIQIKRAQASNGNGNHE